MELPKYGTIKELEIKLNGAKRFTKDNCPFCHDISNNQRVIWKGKYWAIIHNLYPYVGKNLFTMLVPVQHRVFHEHITAEEFAELPKAYEYLKILYNGSYFSFTRESLDERSVEHIHTHFVQ